MNSGISCGDDLFRAAEAAMASDPQRQTEFVRLVKRAAAMGHVEAQEALASWLLEGMTSPSGKRILARSPRRAVKLFQLAANAGLAVAQHELGYCYDVGVGVPRDPTVAIEWYRRSARQGVAISAMNIAILFREMGDARSERRWLRRAAELGLEEAQVAVARATLSSRRAEVEWKAAIRVLKRIAAADLEPESGEAMFALAAAYRKGTGVPRSATMECRWLKKASASGHEEAARQLADIEESTR